ncbi:hypothetical protein HYD_5960 [Candidatus Hydrogenosomobacter endosymbioticus]|uniref:Bacterial sugar transferase domain-containing protein n=1 Tax=Candidatus Hydrogenosomobacter endosymbioticus TaxID=2558174 RepID=A0ABM7VAD5_9PROT|nr:hypothetical protein HYD_5960 [Candidatus Hydrogenosomobacter endosymbioticus]
MFFLQERIGYAEKPFFIIKFRSMRIPESSNSDAQRLSSYGKFIRKHSLDEIVTIINVIKGDMSLVGPRPLLPEYLPLYTKRQKIRHSVKPGLTGMTQVMGRNSLKWTRKFAYDVWYTHNASFLLDMYIIAKTVSVVVLASGTSHKGHATMPKFGEKNS